MLNIVFFGDSIGFGQFVSPSKVWVTRISEKLHHERDDFIISNPSISGNTTRMALSRMAYDVQSHGVDVIYIQYGINDCNYWETDFGVPRVSKECFKANLCEIISRARVSGAKKVLMGTNHPTDKNVTVSGIEVPHQRENILYNEVIRNVANDGAEVQLIDMEQVFFDEIEKGVGLNDLLLDDGIHLTVKGHDVYYNKILPIIESAVADIS